MSPTQFRLLAALAAALLGSGTASAAEETVRIDMDGVAIVGTLNVPNGATKPPVVLMLHGFTGQRNEFPIAGTDTNLFTRTAAKLADAGIASLRIDFRGSGESGGQWKDTTFTSQIADAVRAFDYLENEPKIDRTRIGLLGYSQGGLVASHVAAERPEAFAVTLWAPVANPVRTFSGILGSENVEKASVASDSETFTSNLSWGGTTTLGAPYFKDLFRKNPAAALAHYRGPLQVLVGARETIVTPQPASGQMFLDYHDGEEILEILDADHDWNAEKTSSETVDKELIPKTVQWFGSHF